MTQFAAGFLICLIMFNGFPFAQTQGTQAQKELKENDQTLRIKTDLIEVRAVVKNKKGEVIENLKREDFEILENGRPQEISFFSAEHIVKDSPSGATSRGSTATGKPPASRPLTPGRSIALFVDTLNLSVSSLARVKATLNQFIEKQVNDGDVVSIVPSSGIFAGLQQFTSNKQILRYTISRLRPSLAGKESLFTPFLAAMLMRRDRDAVLVSTAVYQAEEGGLVPEIAGRDPLTADMMVEARAQNVLSEANSKRGMTLSALKSVITQMSELPGQRIVVFISDGFTLMGESGEFQTQEIQAIVGRAGRSGVVINALNAKGLDTDAHFGAHMKVPTTTASLTYFQRASSEDLKNGMNALARDTGGRFVYNNNDLGAGLQKIVDDSRAYYALAFYPVNEKEDGKFRFITIRIKDHPDYEIITQKGYLPPDSVKEATGTHTLSPQQRLTKALIAPLPGGEIGLNISPNYLESETDGSQLTLQMHIDGNTLDYQEVQKHFKLNLQVMALIYDIRGKAVGSYAGKIEGQLTGERLEQLKQNGLRHVIQFVLKPGLYQVRVAARETATERIGTAFDWLEVPDLRQRKIFLSSIQLMESSANEGKQSTAVANPEYFFPKVRRGISTYKRLSSLTYVLAVYSKEFAKVNRQSEPLIQAEIYSDDRLVYQSDWQAVSSRLINLGKKGMQVGGLVKLDMPAGIYELRIVVKDAQTKQPLSQSVLFEIES